MNKAKESAPIPTFWLKICAPDPSPRIELVQDTPHSKRSAYASYRQAYSVPDTFDLIDHVKAGFSVLERVR